MKQSTLFTFFCFLIATLVFIHIIKDINHANMIYLNMLMQFSFMVVLIDIGIHAKDMQSTHTKEEKSPLPNYQFTASKLGISTMCFSLVAQSLIA